MRRHPKPASNRRAQRVMPRLATNKHRTTNTSARVQLLVVTQTHRDFVSQTLKRLAQVRLRPIISTRKRKRRNRTKRPNSPLSTRRARRRRRRRRRKRNHRQTTLPRLRDRAANLLAHRLVKMPTTKRNRSRKHKIRPVRDQHLRRSIPKIKMQNRLARITAHTRKPAITIAVIDTPPSAPPEDRYINRTPAATPKPRVHRNRLELQT